MNYIKILLILIMNIFLISQINANTFNSNTINFSEEEKEFIQKHPVIKFSDVKWEPFFTINENTYSGIFKEYYKLIEERTGLKFEFVKFNDGVNFQLVLDALRNKEIDMIDGTGKTADRASYSLFSEPLMKVSLAIISNKSKKYTSLNELKNKIIVLAKGSTASEYLKEILPNGKYIYTEGLNEAIALIENKQADAFVDNIVVLDYLIKNFYYKDVQVSGITDYDFTIYALIRNDYKILQSILNKAIKSITKEELFNINNLLILESLGPQKNKINFTNIEKNYIENKVIKIAMLKEFYPFSFLENDNIKGYSYDFLNLIIQNSGLKVEFIFDSWNNNLEKFKKGEVDLIDSISYKKEREIYTDFTESYFEIPNVIFSKKNDFENYKGLISLYNKRVGITKDIYYYEDIKNITNIELVEFESTKEKIKALAYDRVDAIFDNYANGMKYIKEGAYTNIKVLDEMDSNIVKNQDLRIGIQKNEALLKNIISKSINDISTKDKMNLYDKWFNGQYSSEENNFIKLNSDELKYLKNKQSIKMCVNPNWKPYEEIKDGKHIGLVADFIELIEKKINKKIDLIPTKNWQESLSFIKQNKCEILSFLNESDLRKEYLNFTRSLYKEFNVIVTRNDVPYIDGLEALNGKSVAVIKGYIYSELEKNLNLKINFRYVEDSEEAIKMVADGEVFATLGSFLSTVNIMKKLNLVNIKIAGKTKIENDYKIGIIKDDTILLSILSKGVNLITQKEKEKIIGDYISIKIEQNFDYSLFWKIVSAIFLIGLFFVYRSYQMNKLNKLLNEKVKKELLKSKDKDKLIFHQNKMSSMGQMIETIAHQWRQPLSQINSSVLLIDDILFQKNINDPLLEEKLLEIEKMTKYMSNTIDDFKGFIINNKEKLDFNIEEIITQSINLLKPSLDFNGIDIEIIIESKECLITGYPNELQHAILVILNNSKDEFLQKKIKEKKITICLESKNNFYEIKINDNAGGIKEEDIEKIFEPYFTTKLQSHGTGLGLYITKKIIEERMNGHIEVENKNNGALFKISLKKDLNV
ncbi:MAG: transporter substrate-binding domain-containing protein [Aliarcobacter sp.]|nr:transporter substrate-binding domain-containing protein [Aliarcobacter sp.]